MPTVSLVIQYIFSHPPPFCDISRPAEQATYIMAGS